MPSGGSARRANALARPWGPHSLTGWAMSEFIGNPDPKLVDPDIGVGDLLTSQGNRITAIASDMSGAEDTELARLQQECRRLEAQVKAQASELSLQRAQFARYETALRASQVT